MVQIIKQYVIFVKKRINSLNVSDRIKLKKRVSNR